MQAHQSSHAKQTFKKLGLNVKPGKHILDQYGYLAGTDINRVQDIHTMFTDRSVKAIIAMRGGWGCNRLLPLLNYPRIRSHPKIIIGYSDITSLLLAINARSRLITFHGAVANSTWNKFTINYYPLIVTSPYMDFCHHRIREGQQAAILKNNPH